MSFFYKINSLISFKKGRIYEQLRPGKEKICNAAYSILTVMGYTSQMSKKILTFISKYAKISYNIMGGKIWKML